MSRGNVDILSLSIVRSPLTHMAGVEGNRAIVMREPVITPDGIRYVPCITGNAIRHRCLRRPLAYDLVTRWGLSGKLTIGQLNFLFHGGSLTEKGGRVSIADQQDLYAAMPHVKLLGCSLPGQIVPGNTACWRGLMVCRENWDRLRSLLPEEFTLPKHLRPAVTMIDGYQYTRGDRAKSAPDIVASDEQHDAPEDDTPEPVADEPAQRSLFDEVAEVEEDADADKPDTPEPAKRGRKKKASDSLMIFEGQAVSSGAAFVHGFTLHHPTDVEIGGLLYGLRLWQLSGGTVGGQSARGHGRLDTYVLLPDDVDQDELTTAYLTHTEGTKDAALALLARAFHTEEKAKPEPKPKASRKRRPSDDDEAAAD